ncbi:hypothetical protein CP556_15155 [Natrinema sp. CBA1119]|uniref:hypothetical protein n=1 Tax=Natrinema sp. CBA1119 TaxID=1608465 RepID=UPI000BF978E2|nr:hypothetical protein [Natrinema sp. CBA1119]PGF18374.1 hypothetical protein CP556_15155 [Natrinema sp. CBA1119]
MGIREYFESDLRFYYAVGVFVILVFVSGIAIVGVLELAAIDARLIPLIVGFFLFMFVYFISVSVQALEPN